MKTHQGVPLRGKRGKMVVEEIVMLVLTLLVFGILFLFVARAATGHLVYEEAYAKKVALFLDNSRSEMTIKFYAGDAINVAKKNKITNLDEIIKLNSSGGKVYVDLSGSGGYVHRYFSDSVVEIKREGEYFILTIF